MNKIDPELMYQTLKANQGSKLKHIAKLMSLGESVVTDRMRALRVSGRTISLGHGKSLGWYTMDYYVWHKGFLDKKHEPKTIGKGHSGEKAHDSEEREWIRSVNRLDQLMPRPV